MENKGLDAKQLAAIMFELYMFCSTKLNKNCCNLIIKTNKGTLKCNIQFSMDNADKTESEE